MSTRVRFAPSPTGYLHVGGLRTALYNYLFAKSTGGTLVLRIEDTDRTRFVEDSQANLIESLKWCGIEFDEGPSQGGDYGPYIQSERFDLYSKYAQELIDNGTAYYAFDTAEELDAMREKQKAAGIAPKYDRSTMRSQYTLGEEKTKELLESGAPCVIRLKVPHEEIKYEDLIRGKVSVNGKDVDDQILLKSDGFPTYHLANVVDDHLMKITHVIRGEEWLPSVPKHILLYKAFGWEMPKFAHLPLLLNQNKQKLSKRHGDVAVEDFKQKGYFADAFVNFIALLGWNPSGEREIYSIQELIDGFNIEKVNKGGAIFDRHKLLWMNSEYLKKKPLSELADNLIPKLEQEGIAYKSKEYVEAVIDLFKERVNFVEEIPAFGDYMFGDISSFDESYVEKQWKADTYSTIKPLIDDLQSLTDWTDASIHDVVKSFVESSGLGFGKVMNPFRLMLTGKSVGASLTLTMELLGKDECFNRIDTFVKLHNEH
jgi:glutamyl-tRNA synthetase